MNACKDRLRRSSRRTAVDISDELALATADPYVRTHERDAIDQALATLSPDHRIVIALRYDRDLAADEIARRLDIPVGTVRSRLHYALRYLHETIDGLAREGIDAMNDADTTSISSAASGRTSATRGSRTRRRRRCAPRCSRSRAWRSSTRRGVAGSAA